MSFEPTPTQALLLFALLARHGECPQAELMPAVKKTDREVLVTAKLLATERVGRGIFLRLEDSGWEWASSHLDFNLPPAHRPTSDILMRVGDHLRKSGETLADFIGSKPTKATKFTSKSPIQPKPIRKGRALQNADPTKAKTNKVLSPATLRKRIEAAYLTLARNKKNQAVKLSALRRELHDIDRSTMDAALGRILAGDRKASLMRHDDPRQIDAADHEAAFNPFGEPFHVLWISS